VVLARIFHRAATAAAQHPRSTAGTAMLELVFVLPVLLLILFAIVECGILLGRWVTLSNAAREGARLAVVYRQNCDAGSVETQVKQRVIDYANDLGLSVGTGDITVSGLCGGADTNSTVSVDYLFNFHVVPGFAPSLSPTLNLSGNSAMRNEGDS